MKTQQEIEDKIKEIEKDYRHVLTGSIATININAPRALQQLSAESRLHALHWVLDSKYISKLEGTNT